MIGILVALPIEARCFTSQKMAVGQTLAIKNNFLVRVSGMGAAAAQAAAAQLIADGVTALVSWGTAGGLAPDLLPGQLLMPSWVMDQQHNRFAVDKVWRARLQNQIIDQSVVRDGVLLQSSRIISTIADKQDLFRLYHAHAVDMESAAIAATAHAAELPFIAVRSIVDAADFALPEWLYQTLKFSGEMRPFTLIKKLCRDPRRVPELMQLAWYFSRSKVSLNQVSDTLMAYA
jgi:adenosylhomocysteine nucleosidase